MIITAAVFIVGYNQQRLILGRPIAQGIVDVMNQLLTQSNVVIGVLTVATSVPTGL